MTGATLPSGQAIASVPSGRLYWWVSRAYLRVAHPDTLRAVLDELGQRITQRGSGAEATALVDEAREAYVAGAARRAETVRRKKEEHTHRVAEAAARRKTEREARRAELMRVRAEIQREVCERPRPTITFRDRKDIGPFQP